MYLLQAEYVWRAKRCKIQETKLAFVTFSKFIIKIKTDFSQARQNQFMFN